MRFQKPSTHLHPPFFSLWPRRGSSGMGTPVYTPQVSLKQNYLFSRHPESLTSSDLIWGGWRREKAGRNTDALFFSFFPSRCLHPFPSFHPLSVFLLEVKRGRTGGCGMYDQGAGGGGASSFFLFFVSFCFCCHLSAWRGSAPASPLPRPPVPLKDAGRRCEFEHCWNHQPGRKTASETGG